MLSIVPVVVANAVDIVKSYCFSYYFNISSDFDWNYRYYDY